MIDLCYFTTFLVIMFTILCFTKKKNLSLYKVKSYRYNGMIYLRNQSYSNNGIKKEINDFLGKFYFYINSKNINTTFDRFISSEHGLKKSIIDGCDKLLYFYQKHKNKCDPQWIATGKISSNEYKKLYKNISDKFTMYFILYYTIDNLKKIKNDKNITSHMIGIDPKVQKYTELLKMLYFYNSNMSYGNDFYNVFTKIDTTDVFTIINEFINDFTWWEKIIVQNLFSDSYQYLQEHEQLFHHIYDQDYI